MAADGSSGDFKDEVARWTRVGEVGMEAGLREVGCTEDAIAKVLSCLGASHFIYPYPSRFIFPILRMEESKDAPAVFFATLGRGISSHVKDFWADQVHITNESEAIALIVNLTTNTSFKGFALQRLAGLLRKRIPLLATAFKQNSTLQLASMRSCGLESEDVRCLLDGFKANEALRLTDLDLSHNAIGDEGVMAVANFLTTNVTVKTLQLKDVSCGFEGANHIAAALEQNSTLEELFCGENPLTTNGMKRLLEPLSGNPRDAGNPSKGPKNTTLRALDLDGTKREHFCAESVALMIKTNRCLRNLDLRFVDLLPEHWTKRIFPSLQENYTLETLILVRCTGLTEDAHQVLLDALKFSATVLTKIDLTSTELESKQGSVDEELRIGTKRTGAN